MTFLRREKREMSRREVSLRKEAAFRRPLAADDFKSRLDINLVIRNYTS